MTTGRINQVTAMPGRVPIAGNPRRSLLQTKPLPLRPSLPSPSIPSRRSSGIACIAPVAAGVQASFVRRRSAGRSRGAGLFACSTDDTVSLVPSALASPLRASSLRHHRDSYRRQAAGRVDRRPNRHSTPRYLASTAPSPHRPGFCNGWSSAERHAHHVGSNMHTASATYKNSTDLDRRQN